MHSETPPRKHRFFWTILILVVVLVGTDQVYRTVLHMQVKREMSALRHDGVPVGATELQKWVGVVADQENAALKILEAADYVVAPPDGFNREVWPRRSEELGPQERDELKENVTNNAPALEAVHAAAQLKQSQFHLDYSRGPALLLPHLAKIKSLSQLLKWEAYLYSEEGQTDRAVKSVMDGVSLARSLDREPLLISQLVRIACLAIDGSALEREKTALRREPELAGEQGVVPDLGMAIERQVI